MVPIGLLSNPWIRSLLSRLTRRWILPGARLKIHPSTVSSGSWPFRWLPGVCGVCGVYGVCGVCGAERERERERECEPEFVSGFFPGLYIRKFRELFTMNFTIKNGFFTNGRPETRESRVRRRHTFYDMVLNWVT